jgi:hypothetical protein
MVFVQVSVIGAKVGPLYTGAPAGYKAFGVASYGAPYAGGGMLYGEAPGAKDGALMGGDVLGIA